MHTQSGAGFVFSASSAKYTTLSSQCTLQSAQHSLIKDHQARGSNMQGIHYLQLIAFPGATVKNELKFFCYFFFQHLHRIGICLKVLNHLRCSQTPFIMYASALSLKHGSV